MEDTDIRIHCEAMHGYVGFVASISVNNDGFRQRTTLSVLTPELAGVVKDIEDEPSATQLPKNASCTDPHVK